MTQTSTNIRALIEYLFDSLRLRQRLREASAHLRPSPVYSFAHVFGVLLIHILLGFRRLREIDYWGSVPRTQPPARVAWSPERPGAARLRDLLDRSADLELMQEALVMLTEWLHRTLGERVVILVEE